MLVAFTKSQIITTYGPQYEGMTPSCQLLYGQFCLPWGFKVVISFHCLIKKVMIDGILSGLQEQAA